MTTDPLPARHRAEGRAPDGDALLRVEDLRTHFPVTRGLWGRTVGHVKAVDGVSLSLRQGETLGVVGESGCGKTTLGRSILRLIEPTSGHVFFDGRDVTGLGRAQLRDLRRDMQIIFQDPFSSLNPRMRIVDIIGEPLLIHKLARPADLEARGARLLDKVGLPRSALHRYPHEFSGGQRQRIGIARAIALEPKLIICDEAVSALDVSIQAQVLNLLIELQREMNLSYLFIAHDLSVIKHISSRVAVMYLGQIVELGNTTDLFEHPSHPYTEALLSAIPRPVPGRKINRRLLPGDVPSPIDPPKGCRFHTRCPAVFGRCNSQEPQLFQVTTRHHSACFHAERLPSEHAEAHAEAKRRMDLRIEERQVELDTAESAPVELNPLAPAVALLDDPVASLVRLALPAASIATVLALILLLSGYGGLAWIFFLVPYFTHLRTRWPGAWARRGLLTTALAACLVLGQFAKRGWQTRRAENQLNALREEITGFTRTRGRLPRRLGELSWRLYPLFLSGQPIDPWRQPWRYQVDVQKDRFSLVSLGPDGKLGGDDIALIEVDPATDESESPISNPVH